MNIENFDEMTDFQQWVICNSFKVEDVEHKADEYHQIAITFDGIECDFLEFCNTLEWAMDCEIIKKARELAIEKFNDIMTLSSEFYMTLDEMQKDLETKIRHRMELPTWEERFGE